MNNWQKHQQNRAIAALDALNSVQKIAMTENLFKRPQLY
jgi:hypothetical protein